MNKVDFGYPRIRAQRGHKVARKILVQLMDWPQIHLDSTLLLDMVDKVLVLLRIMGKPGLNQQPQQILIFITYV